MSLCALGVFDQRLAVLMWENTAEDGRREGGREGQEERRGEKRRRGEESPQIRPCVTFKVFTEEGEKENDRRKGCFTEGLVQLTST